MKLYSRFFPTLLSKMSLRMSKQTRRA